MDYPNKPHMEKPVTYCGHTIKLSSFETEDGYWTPAYQIFYGDDRICDVTVSPPSATKSDAVERAMRNAKKTIDDRN